MFTDLKCAHPIESIIYKKFGFLPILGMLFTKTHWKLRKNVRNFAKFYGEKQLVENGPKIFSYRVSQSYVSRKKPLLLGPQSN